MSGSMILIVHGNVECVHHVNTLLNSVVPLQCINCSNYVLIAWEIESQRSCAWWECAMWMLSFALQTGHVVKGCQCMHWSAWWRDKEKLSPPSNPHPPLRLLTPQKPKMTGKVPRRRSVRGKCLWGMWCDVGLKTEGLSERESFGAFVSVAFVLLCV